MTMETSLNKGGICLLLLNFFANQCYLNQIRFQAITLPFLSYCLPKKGGQQSNFTNLLNRCSCFVHCPKIPNDNVHKR